jgi:hypothetical protein
MNSACLTGRPSHAARWRTALENLDAHRWAEVRSTAMKNSAQPPGCEARTSRRMRCGRSPSPHRPRAPPPPRHRPRCAQESRSDRVAPHAQDPHQHGEIQHQLDVRDRQRTDRHDGRLQLERRHRHEAQQEQRCGTTAVGSHLNDSSGPYMTSVEAGSAPLRRGQTAALPTRPRPSLRPVRRSVESGQGIDRD